MSLGLPAGQGGFADPVLDAQATFRLVMDAMARPATVHRIDAAVTPPKPLSPAAGAIACTLADVDTPVWLDARLRENEEVAGWLAFHTGAPLTEDPMEARFALVSAPAEMPALDGFAPGSQDYPDRSTTLILQVVTLSDGETVTFAGPGIRNRASVAPAPLPRHFASQWAANRARFPRGVDLILAAPEAVVCLPRTARLPDAEA